VFGWSNPCWAGVFERDWKTPGDGLLTYDDVNRREWLDLSQTILSSQFPGENPSPLITRENRYQYVVSQTAPAGLFEGFSVAKSPDAIALAQSAGINTSTLDENINGAAALSLGQLLGFTYEAPNGFNVAIGLLDEPPVRNIRPGAEIHSAPTQAGLAIGLSHFQIDSPPGVMLFRFVPEPSMAILAYFALNVMLIVRPRRAVNARVNSKEEFLCPTLFAKNVDLRRRHECDLKRFG
jgi:hypothetical protein